MEIIFKSTWPAPGAVPSGEIYIRPANPDDAGRRDMATFVCAHGVKPLLQGAAPLTHIVVPCDTTRPTLDDLLAASFVQRILEGTGLGGSAAAFGKYAGLVREGLQPGDMPLENSMEGIFLSIRSSSGDDLSKSSAADKLLGDWDRMARVILAAADAGKDPFNTDLFGESSEFARERAFLKKDQDVYREDVNRGQKWIVQVPGGPESSAMLILDQPRSLLWKYWSRKDATAPTGGAYLLLVVHWTPGNWVISTDPVQRLPIKSLADALQAAEARKDAGRAAADPWFDGAPFGHTLVATPRGGSQLSDEEISQTIRKWAKAKPVVDVTKHVARRVLAISGGAGVTLMITILASILTTRFQPKPAPSQAGPAPAQQVDFHVRGSALSDVAVQDLRSQGIVIPGYAVIVGVGGRQGEFPGLPASCRNARLFYKLLVDYYGFDPKNMRLLTDQPKNPNDAEDPDIKPDGAPTKDGVQKAINDIAAQTVRYPSGNRTNFVFFYGGHGDPRQMGENKIGYLVLSGYTRDDPDSTGFDMGYLVKFVSQRVTSSHQMLLVDCCYSGFVIKARGLGDDKNKAAIYEMWKEKARAVITAGTADQQSLEVGPKALFTSNLIRGLTPTDEGHLLADENHDGVVTDEELADYLAGVVSSEARSLPGHHELTPQYLRALPDSDDEVGQFLFIPRNLRK